jgi:hypothetical protein
MVGRTISHYRIVGQLGMGGMGVVYSAEDLRLGRGVALKFVSEDFASDLSAVERLRFEARAASALNHPNICTIYDIDEQEGHPFIVMELMKGQSLRDRLAAGPLRVHQIVNAGIELADALDAAHSGGIVHRDIKPGNIFVTERGPVKILDFGLAKLAPKRVGSTTTEEGERTALGLTLGTVSYMSPEQAAGEELDGRTDLFSLGVVLYEVATGRHPFPGKTTAVVLAAILNRAPMAPTAINHELPMRLQEVISNCLEKDRELRYQSAADLRADLKRVKRDLESGQSRPVDVAGESVAPGSGQSAVSAVPAVDTAVTASGPPNASAAPRPRGLARLAVAGAVLVVAAAAGFAVWQRTTLSVTGPDPVEERRHLPDATVRDRIGLAEASLAAGDFRAALAYADEVLVVSPGHPDAAKIRDQASAGAARFDAAIADLRQHLARGDLTAAARSLDTARGLAATAPVVSELSTQLAREAGARQDALARERAVAGAGRTQEGPDRLPRDQTLPARDAIRTDAARSEATPAVAAPPAPTVPGDAPPPVYSSPPPAATPVTAPAAGVPAAPEVPAAPGTPPTAGASQALPTVGKGDRKPEAPAATAADHDDEEIRSVAAAYARAIEGKDLALFRSIKPNLSREEERRLRDGFKAVASQRVQLTVLSIDRRGDRASVALRRRDTIDVGGRDETTERGQTLTLARTGGGWVIVEIR